MLAGVLLHVIEAAGPIDAAIDATDGDGAVHDLDDAVILIQHIDDVCVAELAEVMRLAAGGGIQQGLVKNNAPARSKAAVFGFRQKFAAQNLSAEIILE